MAKNEIADFCKAQAQSHKMSAKHAVKLASRERDEGFELLADLIETRAAESRQLAEEWLHIAREARKVRATMK